MQAIRRPCARAVQSWLIRQRRCPAPEGPGSVVSERYAPALRSPSQLSLAGKAAPCKRGSRDPGPFDTKSLLTQDRHARAPAGLGLELSPDCLVVAIHDNADGSSAAARAAGIRIGDRVTCVDGVSVATREQTRDCALAASARAASTMQVDVQRAIDPTPMTRLKEGWLLKVRQGGRERAPRGIRLCTPK